MFSFYFSVGRGRFCSFCTSPVRFALRGVPIILGKGSETAFLLPNALGGRRPGGSISIALGAQRLGTLRSQEVGGLGAGLADDPPQSCRVFQHGTGPQHIIIKGLALIIFVKQRRLQTFFNALLPNVGVAVMDKHTRLRVTLGIDVKVVAPTGNTTAYKLRVVFGNPR